MGYVQYVVIDHSIENSAIFGHQDSTRTTSFLLRHADTLNAQVVIAKSANGLEIVWMPFRPPQGGSSAVLGAKSCIKVVAGF